MTDVAFVVSSLTSGSWQVLQAPLDYLLTIPGKDVRGKMMDAFNLWLQIPEEKLIIIKEVVKLLHTASLL